MLDLCIVSLIFQTLFCIIVGESMRENLALLSLVKLIFERNEKSANLTEVI